MTIRELVSKIQEGLNPDYFKYLKQLENKLYEAEDKSDKIYYDTEDVYL